MSCLTDLEIIAFLSGGLSSEARLRAEVHLDACSLCIHVMAAAGMTSAAEHRRMEEVGPGPLLSDGEPRYVVGPEIARGGMGRIFAGEDRLLGRQVALKLLRRSSASLARRFLREQRISARLQHPAIVPVYDAGKLDDGEPFLVMRLVKGQSLDRCAARAASLAERLQLLPAVLAVVDAVAYAHGEGVVHRDLKPQNVLVGPFGEVVVLDWGLARELNAGGDADAKAQEMETGGSDDRGMTRDGERLGTLAYMAPEQAEGHAADARSDVYGLGAILYHVLAGRPPHVERTTSLSTTAVMHAPPALALLVPEAPLDLMAIVALALAPEPGARYASALELAADLKRWQAGRLVEAHRYSLRELLQRYMHRHRAPLLVGAVSLLVLLGLGAVGLWQILAERGHALAAQAVAEEAQVVAEDARLRAETQRVAAEKLVAFILDELRSRLEGLGRLDVLASTAHAVMAYQNRALAAEDVEARLRRAQAAEMAAAVAFALGDFETAEENYRQSRAAAAEAGDSEAQTIARCRAENGLGDLIGRRGESAVSASHYEACGALTRDATSPRLRSLYLASRLGLALANGGDSGAVRTLLEGGLAEATTLAGSEGPGSQAFKLMLLFQAHLWQTLSGSGEATAAREAALAWQALARAHVEALPVDTDARFSLARSLNALASSERDLGNGAAALRICEESLTVHRWLVAQSPTNVEWQHSLLFLNQMQGTLLVENGDPAAALPFFQSALDSVEPLAASSPDDLFRQNSLSGMLMAKGRALRALGRLSEARREYQRAIDINERLVERDPAEYSLLLGRALVQWLGPLELQAHRTAAGQAALLRGIELLRQHFGGHDDPGVRADLAAALAALAESERGPAAREHIEEAVALMQPLWGQESLDFMLRIRRDEVQRVQRLLRARR